MDSIVWEQRRKNDFENAKLQCLGKRDKSSAGRIDPHAVDICGIINEKEEYFTTSSCAGRCFMYRGSGFKATTNFKRFRVSHEKIQDPNRFFDLTTIDSDPSGGGDRIPCIGQYDYKNETTLDEVDDSDEKYTQENINQESKMMDESTMDSSPIRRTAADQSIWLRFEPFILHVACRSLPAAAGIMAAARPAFKNVGLTTWKDSRYLVAVWGDEGLEMPLCTPEGKPLDYDSLWLAEMINERHERNWNKIQRFCHGVREMTSLYDEDETEQNPIEIMIPKSYDVIGDVALIHSKPETNPELIGNAIMKKNKSIKVVVARNSNLEGTERAPGMEGLQIIAGSHRSPLITTHTEYGIKCVVDLNHTFFSPRMGKERLRICQQVARGEEVLVLFAGVGMEAFQIAGRTEAASVIAIELNEVAVNCAHRAHRMLERNKAVKCSGAAERLQIIHGDVRDVLPNLERNRFDRILAPRPKEGSLDGDLGSGDGGEVFLDMMISHLKNGGECHWYDFVADQEFPACERTKKLFERVAGKHAGCEIKVLHVANAGSVAMRQYRVCLDFKLFRR